MQRSSLLVVCGLICLCFPASAAVLDVPPVCNSGDGIYENAASPAKWKFQIGKYFYGQVNGLAISDPMYLRVRVTRTTDIGRLQIQYNKAGGSSGTGALDWGYSENVGGGYLDYLVKMPGFAANHALNCKADFRIQASREVVSFFSVTIGSSLGELGQCSTDGIFAPTCGSSTANCLAPCSNVRVTPGSLAFPARSIFTYPWHPNFSRNGVTIRFTPDLGFYSSSSPKVIDRHIEVMKYGKIDLAIFSWWGIDTNSEKNVVPMMLQHTKMLGADIKYAPYYEKEGFADKDSSLETLRADLKYIKERYAGHENFARVNGKPVVFVWNVNSPTCSKTVDKWRSAANGEWHVVLKVFSGASQCNHNFGSWHQYGVGSTGEVTSPDAQSFCIGAGYWDADSSTPRVARDPARWSRNIQNMMASNYDWHLIVSMSEWGEGTAIEPTKEWASASGYGVYFDALHVDGNPSKPLTCYTLFPPANSVGNACRGALAGATCKFTCNSGFTPINPDARTCKSDGTWTGSATLCASGGGPLPTPRPSVPPSPRPITPTAPTGSGGSKRVFVGCVDSEEQLVSPTYKHQSTLDLMEAFAKANRFTHFAVTGTSSSSTIAHGFMSNGYKPPLSTATCSPYGNSAKKNQASSASWAVYQVDGGSVPIAGLHYVIAGDSTAYAASYPLTCLQDSTVNAPRMPSGTKAIGITCCNSAGVGTRPGCQKGTYSFADSHCKSQGLGLCTRAQIQAGSGRGSGCGFDSGHVWTKDTCTAVKAGYVESSETSPLDGADDDYDYPTIGSASRTSFAWSVAGFLLIPAVFLLR